MALRGHGAFRGQRKGAIDGGRIWWVVRDYRQVVSSGIWEDIKKATHGAWIDKSEQQMSVTLPGGGSISVMSADNPESLRGAGLDGLIGDEMAFTAPEVWRERLRPALADRKGWAAIITTPNGQNWFWKSFLKWKRDPEWECWQRPSSDNPLLTAEELASIKRELGPIRYAQEIEALATESEGVLWPGSYFEDEVIYSSDFPQTFEMSSLYLDPSIGNESKQGDYSAIIFAGLRNGRIWVRADLEKRPPGKIVQDFYEMWLRFNPTLAGIETNGFQSVLLPLLQNYAQSNGLPVIPIVPVVNSERKGVRIQRLDPYLASGEIKIYPDRGGELLVEQMQMFPVKEYHDDGPDGLEGAVRLLSMIQQAELRGEPQEEYVTT